MHSNQYTGGLRRNPNSVCAISVPLVVGPGSPAVRILDSRPCGHVAALLGGARLLGLPALLHVRPSRSRDLALALVLMRLLLPASRLATARKLAPDAEFAALNEALGLGPVSEQQLYDTLDLKWLRNGGQLRLRQMRQRSNCVRWCRIHHRQGGQ